MSIFRKLLIPAFILVIFSSTGFSQSAIEAERFSAHDPNSTVRINHRPLTNYLDATVLAVGRSYRIMGNEKPDTYRASRIKTSKALSSSRFEGGRLFVSAFADEHKYFFKAYQQGLENLSNRRSLSTLNKNEQLAFWLNLYNVIVINKIVEEYPIQKLKSLRSTKRGKSSFWNEKITNIEGVSLSLRDIERILFANYDTPLVAFGLWQGSVGGPTLLNYAFTARNVGRALESNALEFVNSNRGLKPPTGSRMSVSKFYEWMLPAFGTSEDHVLMFIREFADPNFVQGVSSVTSLNFKIFDWNIASIFGGNMHSGSSNQLGGILRAGGNADGSGGPVIRTADSTFRGGGASLTGQSSFAGKRNTPGGDETKSATFDIQGNLRRMVDLTPTGAIEGIPEYVVDLLFGIKQNTRLPVPIITTEECAPGEECSIENIDDNGV